MPSTGAKPWERPSGSGSPHFPIPGLPGTDGGLQPLAWTSESQTFQDEEIVISRVTYLSGDLQIVGQVCRPQGAARFPVEVLNHGGFTGLGTDWNGGECMQGAREGRVVLQSAYRGEDGSEGHVEVCQGEVDDVLAMLEVGLAQTYANPEKVMMAGFSHGGCITLRALQRGVRVNAAVDVAGPTDWAALYQWYQQRVVNPPSPRAAAEYQQALTALELALGGSPQTAPEAYASRSPALDLPALVAFPGALMVLHGAQDPLVPISQSCALGTGATAFHVMGNGRTDRAPPQGCSNDGITWQTGTLPQSNWPDNRYLLIFDDAAHSMSGASGTSMLNEARSFLVSRVGS